MDPKLLNFKNIHFQLTVTFFFASRCMDRCQALAKGVRTGSYMLMDADIGLRHGM